MPQFLIERHVPGIELMGTEALRAVARKSNGVLADLGSDIRWIHSYIVNGKTYCVYEAPDEELIREHARLSGFPANRITVIARLLDPSMGR